MLLLKFENVKVSYSKAPNVHVCLIVYGNTCQYLECYYGLLLLTIVSNIKLLKIIIFDIPGNHEKARTFPEINIKPESLLMLSWVIEREQWPSIS